MNNNTLEYVGSGMGRTRMMLNDIPEHPALLEYIRAGLSLLNSDPLHKHGVLYNSLMEPKYGSVIHNLYRDTLHSVHADSGGLQVMTLGKVMTPELKFGVYENQAAYCDVGMSFDDIPVISTSKTSVVDITGRYYDPSLIKERAHSSAVNIVEQERVFAELGTDAQVCAIVHGQTGEDLRLWADTMRDVLGHDFGKVSFATAAMGNGAKEDVKSAFYAGLLKGGANHLHFLGVGSVRRLLPVLIFMQSGLYQNLHISYDSTSLSSASVGGKYYMATGAINLHRQHHNEWNDVYDDIHGMLPLPYDREYFHRMSTTSPTRTEDFAGPIYQTFSMYMGSVLNFKRNISLLLSDRDLLLSTLRTPLLRQVYKSLYDVNSEKDFDDWMRLAGRYLRSDSLMPLSTQTLTDFL